ncbi:MAG: hypothetical protein JWO38_2998 [Gemmataceae bacterium]|nr:hypothetical protein [Gemmataceae bacterium]
MNGNWCNSGGGCGLARGKNGTDAARLKRPRVVLRGGPGFAVQSVEHLRLLGWDVCNASTDADFHTLTSRKNPAAVVLPVEAGGESGFLTCAKLRLTRPKLRVVLVGELTPRAQRLAGFVGAGLATEATAADAVLKLI